MSTYSSLRSALRVTIAASALAVGAVATTPAEATTVLVQTAGIYQPGTIQISGPGANLNAYASALEMVGTVGTSATEHTFYTFCVDIYHYIYVGFDTTNDIVNGRGDAQASVNLPFTAKALTVDSNGATPGVDGSDLSQTQIEEIGGLADLGGALIKSDASDLSNKLAGVQGAIWSIEYPAAAGYTFTAGSAAVQTYLDGYVANAASTEATHPVEALYNASLQGQIPAGGVPEPATWAVMLTGLGLVGATMRRRRMALAPA